MPSLDEDKVPNDLWRRFRERLSDNRQKKLLQVVKKRTEHVKLVLQDVHNPHNVSACLRSAEAFGVLNVDVVCPKEKFNPSTVARGVHKWLQIRRFLDVHSCAKSLRAQGYKIFAGLPTQDSVPIEKMELNSPVAIVFGNEHDGIDNAWYEYLDGTFTIPMVGQVESLNISVSAAITLFSLTSRAAREVANYHIAESRQAELLNNWMARQIPSWQKQYAQVQSESNTMDL